jgi:hypothetical protein
MLALLFLTFINLAFAEDAWVVNATELVRWPETVTPNAPVRSLEVNDKVEVVLRDGAQVRVRKGIDFGWVPATALTDKEPVVETPPALELTPGLELPPGLELSSPLTPPASE